MTIISLEDNGTNEVLNTFRGYWGMFIWLSMEMVQYLLPIQNNEKPSNQ